MHKGIFVTGTGTDIGKTFVTALLVKKLHDAGSAAAYFKAAVSGNERDENGRLIPGDAAYVKRISGISQPLDTMCPYIYETAVSPHLASRIEGDPVEISIPSRHSTKRSAMNMNTLSAKEAAVSYVPYAAMTKRSCLRILSKPSDFPRS